MGSQDEAQQAGRQDCGAVSTDISHRQAGQGNKRIAELSSERRRFGETALGRNRGVETQESQADWQREDD